MRLELLSTLWATTGETRLLTGGELHRVPQAGAVLLPQEEELSSLDVGDDLQLGLVRVDLHLLLVQRHCSMRPLRQ